ncbi:MAG: deoxyuridine 5'-triphosphate nucleotidohydrolase [Candidatus Omnitrophica bacterium]|nr:deoxyuridine 5'-triphosphate nucleotidohydrolase [Candidatus Omnitrophota bacterium]
MLNREEIAKLIKKDKLVEGYIDLEIQLTPNGLDLTVANIYEFDTKGELDFSNKERVIPVGKEILPRKEKQEDKFGWWDLEAGCYKVKTNETVNLAKNLTAICFSRTSLLRMGAFTQHGVWDAGFKGRGEFILVVGNLKGLRIKQNARVAQLVFLSIQETLRGYDGIYQERGR